MESVEMEAWNVYENGKWIDTVYYVPGMSDREILKGLIDHDGYPSNIKVKLRVEK